MIYVLFPTAHEARPMLGALDNTAQAVEGRRRSVTGSLKGRRVTVVVSGVGQANTAQAMTALLEQGSARLVIMGGCGGAYAGSGLRVGDVAVATEEVYGDLGVLTSGEWLTLEDVGLPLVEVEGARYFGRYPIVAGWSGMALRAVDAKGLRPSPASHGRRPEVFFGPFVTVSTVSGTLARGEDMRSRYGALCENMEGAAAAQTAALYGVPFVEVRGISNMVEDRDREGWDIPTASTNCALVVESFLKGLDLWS